jgi:hypothetical protein
MTHGVKYQVTYHQFAHHLGFTAEDLQGKRRIHDDKVMNSNSLIYMYDMEKTGTLGGTKGLLPF